MGTTSAGVRPPLGTRKGLLWVAVRRAVLGEVVAGAHLTGVRNAWRAESTRRVGATGHCHPQPSDPPVSLDVLAEQGWQPAAQPLAASVELGPRLDAVVAALVEAGWGRRAARAVVEGVAVAAERDGKTSGEAVGWRPLAARLGLPPRQVRRVTVLLPRWALIGRISWRR